jgi:PTS system cellobiose-specific IIB component
MGGSTSIRCTAGNARRRSITTILIVCGAGASSTFLAASIRRIAVDRGEALTVKASSDDDLETLLPGADVLLVGAHLAPSFDGLRARADAAGVASALLDPGVFAPGGADDALELALRLAGTPRPALAHPTKDTPHG